MQANPGSSQPTNDPTTLLGAVGNLLGTPAAGSPVTGGAPGVQPPAPTDLPPNAGVPNSPAAPGTSPAAVNNGYSVADLFAAAFADLPPDFATQVTNWANQVHSEQPNATTQMLQSLLVEQPFYKTFFAGNQTLIAQGKQPLDPSAYLNYVQQAEQLARAAGLPAGFMGKGEIDSLIGNSVSMSELTERVNNAYLATQEIENQNPGVTAFLAKNYGIGPGGLLAYVMDPAKALPTLEQQMAAAAVGGAATQAGLQPVSVDEAMKVAEAIGGPSEQAGGASISSVYQQAIQGMKSLAPEIPATEKTRGPGTMPTASQDQLIGAKFIGDLGDVRAVQLAESERTAAFRGGGGIANPGQPGSTGAGFASQ